MREFLINFEVIFLTTNGGGGGGISSGKMDKELETFWPKRKMFRAQAKMFIRAQAKMFRPQDV